MKTKTLIALLLVCAAGAQAATYTSEWSAFDSGLAQSQSGTVTHSGVLGGWVTPVLPVAAPALELPTLTIVLVGNSVRVAWPATAIGFELEEISVLNGGGWTSIPGPYQTDGSEYFILAPLAQDNRFYRLRLP
jgi:hypothetical protein